MARHYQHKSSRRVRMTDDDVIARVKAKCLISDSGCWLWQGFVHWNGYGETSYKCCSISTHRLMYQLHKGVIPAGMLVCHTCDVRNCCNPDHLWLGTLKDNFYDCMAKGRNGHKIKTHCPQGHEYSIENTYVSKVGHRTCKTCDRLKQIRRTQQKREALLRIA